MKTNSMTFINPELTQPKKKAPHPAAYIRCEFFVKDSLQSAILYMTALGVYAAYVNGEAVDDQLLMPGFTNYRARLQVQEYDLTKRLHAGNNALGVILGEGGYRGTTGAMNQTNYYGDQIALAARLILR